MINLLERLVKRVAVLKCRGEASVGPGARRRLKARGVRRRIQTDSLLELPLLPEQSYSFVVSLESGALCFWVVIIRNLSPVLGAQQGDGGPLDVQAVWDLDNVVAPIVVLHLKTEGPNCCNRGPAPLLVSEAITSEALRARLQILETLLPTGQRPRSMGVDPNGE